MPILNYTLTPDGPIVLAQIGVSRPRAQALQIAKQAVPSPVQIQMLVDTGASSTCVEAGVLASLGLPPAGQILMHSASTGGTPVAANQFDISLAIVHPTLSFQIWAMPVIECQPLSGTIQGLLGRDVLSHCMLVYQGQTNAFSLAF